MIGVFATMRYTNPHLLYFTLSHRLPSRFFFGHTCCDVAIFVAIATVASRCRCETFGVDWKWLLNHGVKFS